MLHHLLKAPKIHRGRYLPLCSTLPPKKKSARQNTDNLLPRLSSVQTLWSLELSDKNYISISWISSCCDFFLPFESTTRHRSDLVAVSLNRACGTRNDDVWCIDTRGVLTVCVCKETYEKLGLVGQKMPFKNRSGERYGMYDILMFVCCSFTSFPLPLFVSKASPRWLSYCIPIRGWLLNQVYFI